MYIWNAEMWHAKICHVSNGSYFVSVDNEEDIIITDDEDDEEEVKRFFFACIWIHCQARQVTRTEKSIDGPYLPQEEIFFKTSHPCRNV